MPSIRPWHAPALAFALFAVTAVAPAAQFINVLTGGTSGVYYPLGVALAKIFETAVPDSRPSVQATKASVENLNLLQAGRGELAFTLGDALSQAWSGNADAGFRAPLDKLRTVAAIYPNYIQIVAAQESGIRTLADLKGKRISVGAPKSGTELNARAVLGAAGLKYEDFAKVEYLPFGESVELMKNRQLDATLISAGLGVAWVPDSVRQFQRPGVVYRRIAGPRGKAVPACETSLVWDASREHPVLQRFAGFVRGQLAGA